MHYIIQSNLHQDDGMLRLKEVLTNFNLPFSEHKVIPFIGDLEPEPILPDNNVICFGSYSMRHYAKKKLWNPGVYDCEPYDHDILNHVWGDNMLNFDSSICTFNDSLEIVRSGIRKYGGIFIRPIHDTKVFAGTIMDDIEEFNSWWNGVCVLEEDDGSSLRKNTMVMVSKAINDIVTECRFFVVNDKIITGSIYKQGNKIIYQEVNRDHHIWQNAEKIMKNLKFKINLKSYVIDFAYLMQDVYKIIEINTMNSAGFYACDVQKIIMELEK